MDETTLEAPPIVEGDTVQLISGGPVMLVTRLAEGGSRDTVGGDTCDVAYHDNHGVFQREKNLQVRWLKHAQTAWCVPYIQEVPNTLQPTPVGDQPYNPYAPQVFYTSQAPPNTMSAREGVGFPPTTVEATVPDGEE